MKMKGITCCGDCVYYNIKKHKCIRCENVEPEDAREHFYADCPLPDAEPVRHGHNENREYHEVDEFRCSECGLHLEDWTRYVYDEDSDEEYAQEYVFKHCPECGAKVGD